LAILGRATEIELFLLFSAPTKVAKASKEGENLVRKMKTSVILSYKTATKLIKDSGTKLQNALLKCCDNP
jgi:hypothetical protein